MILIPKFDLGYPHPPHIEAGMTRIRGEFNMVLMDLNLRPVYESPWQPNLITDQGIREMGNAATGNWAAEIAVGSSATAPSVLDTSLGAWMAQGFAGYDSNNTPTAPDYALQTTIVQRFNAGTATGTIREVGLSDSGHADNANLSTRALVSPEVVKNADQVLDVYYRVWRYPDIVDRTGTVNIEGVNYDYIVRGMSFGDNQAPGNFGTHTTTNRIGMRTDTANLACTGEIGSLTDGAPTGASNPWSNLGAGWLGNEVNRAILQAAHDVVLAAQRGQKDDGHIRLLADAGADFPTVHIGHHHVQKNQVGAVGVQQTQALLPAVGGVDLSAFPGKDLLY